MASRRIVTPKQTQTVSFVLDFSGSMDWIARDLENSYKREIAKLREEADKNNVSTTVNVYVFGTRINRLYSNVPLHGSTLDTLKYQNMGGTALYDAIGTAIDDYWQENMPAKGYVDALLVLAITDGEENQSTVYKKTIGRLLSDANKNGNITATIRCPVAMRQTLINDGIPSDNIATWDGSAKELKEVEEKTSGGISSYYAGRSRGITKTASFYQPDTNFSPTKLKREVKDVTHKFLIAGVTNSWSGKQIRDFVEKELSKSYVKGNAFYQLTKTETVQAAKEIVIRDTVSGKMYSDADARDLLGLPSGVEIKVIPSSYSQYEIYIMSTSVNRKLVGGTKVLYKC